jgi:hypothetical protein
MLWIMKPVHSYLKRLRSVKEKAYSSSIRSVISVNGRAPIKISQLKTTSAKDTFSIPSYSEEESST